MRVLHAYNRHRGGGGANNATAATIALQRAAGWAVAVHDRSALDLPGGLAGLRAKADAALGVLWGRQSLQAFVAQLEAFGPEIVHVHELYPLVTPRVLPACSERGIPVVMSCVDFRLTCPVVTHLRDGRLCTDCIDRGPWQALRHDCRGAWAESAAAALYTDVVRRRGLFDRHVARYVLPSDFARDWLVRHGAIDGARAVTIAPALSLPPQAADPGAGRYIAYAGRFAPEKGLPVFAAAARATGLPFRMARNAASLVSTPLPEGPGAPEVVVTHDAAELVAFYRGAAAVVVPSLWFETFGLVAAEAMSHGVPVIGSRIGALAELIDDGVDGLLFEPGDAEGLARQVRRLWDDPELRRRLGAAARDKARRRWADEHHQRQLAALYREVLGRD